MKRATAAVARSVFCLYTLSCGKGKLDLELDGTGGGEFRLEYSGESNSLYPKLEIYQSRPRSYFLCVTRGHGHAHKS